MLATLKRLLGLDPSLERQVLSKRLRALNIVVFMVFLAGIVLADSFAVKVVVFVAFVAVNVGIGMLAKSTAESTIHTDEA